MVPSARSGKQLTRWSGPVGAIGTLPGCPSTAPLQAQRGEPACRPGSVHPLARADGHPSRAAVAGSLVRSTRGHRAGSPQSLAQVLPPKRKDPLDLAPGGVYQAVAVTCGAGGLLHHRFTLTSHLSRDTGRSVFCGTVPRVTPGRRYRPPCPMEPGPSSPGPKAQRDRPAGSPTPEDTRDAR
jgi:hypothetical protein